MLPLRQSLLAAAAICLSAGPAAVAQGPDRTGRRGPAADQTRWTLAPDRPAAADERVYEVGKGRRCPTLADVPWGWLKPGDTVRVHWQPGPYREKVLLSARGTPDRPIHVVGVPGPAGQLPVIDGSGAVTGRTAAFAHPTTQDRGLLVIAPAKGARWGYKPGYLVVENLDLRNAAPPHEFTDASGETRKYARHAAGLFVERAEHLIVRGCAISGCGNGLFVASAGSEEVVSRDVLVEGCVIEGNGDVGRDREHNVYTEAVGITFQFNRFGPPRAGSLGNNLKDRSAGTVIRFNWIAGGAHLLDLVEAEESYPIAGRTPDYHTTRVYGNVFLNGPGDGVNLVHYGGDNGQADTYRKGTLYFCHNTVAVRCDRSGKGGRYRTALLRLETDGEAAEVDNNVVYRAGATAGGEPTELSLLWQAGTARFGPNWVSPGWIPTRSGVAATAKLTGTEHFLGADANDPGLADLAARDLRPRSTSPCAGVAGPLPAAMVGFPVDREYRCPPAGRPAWAPRPGPGRRDLGAFAASRD